MVITSAVFVLLATICVSARFYSRIVVLRSPGLDELAIGVSFVQIPSSSQDSMY